MEQKFNTGSHLGLVILYFVMTAANILQWINNSIAILATLNVITNVLIVVFHGIENKCIM